MTVWAAACRYEWRMQIRRPALWIASALGAAMTFAISGYAVAWSEPDPRVAIARAAVTCVVVPPVVYAFLVSDRASRDAVLHVGEVLDVSPAGGGVRFAGKYAGSCLAAAVPIGLLYLGGAVAYAAVHGSPSALLWALIGAAAVLVPGLAMIGAVALCLPLVLPVTLSRVLLVGLWLWFGWLLPPKTVPGPAESVLSATGGYAIDVFFGYHGPHGGVVGYAGPVPGAVWNAIRPAPSATTAVLQITLMIAVAAAVLAAAALSRRNR